MTNINVYARNLQYLFQRFQKMLLPSLWDRRYFYSCFSPVQQIKCSLTIQNAMDILISIVL